MSYATMTKKITMQIGDMACTATIDSGMSEGQEIYAALRSAFHEKIGVLFHIGIYDRGTQKLARMHFDSLEPNRVYDVATSLEPVHGLIATTRAVRKTVFALAIIVQHWGLADATAIFPPDIAPTEPLDEQPQNPTEWSRQFVEQLRQLSVRTKCNYAHAMQFVIAAMNERHAKQEYVSWPVQTADIKRALSMWRQTTANQALAELEEQENTTLFTGGLGEGLGDGLVEAALLKPVAPECDEDVEDVEGMDDNEMEEESGELKTFELKTTLVDWESLRRTRFR